MIYSSILFVALPAILSARAAPLSLRTYDVEECHSDYRFIHPYDDKSLCLTAPEPSCEGDKLTVEKCCESESQKWVIDKYDGSISLFCSDPELCIDAGKCPANNYLVTLEKCYSGQFSQSWKFTKDGLIALFDHSQCLNNDCGKVETYECCADFPTQHWTVECPKDDCKDDFKDGYKKDLKDGHKEDPKDGHKDDPKDGFKKDSKDGYKDGHKKYDPPCRNVTVTITKTPCPTTVTKTITVSATPHCPTPKPKCHEDKCKDNYDFYHHDDDHWKNCDDNCDLPEHDKPSHPIVYPIVAETALPSVSPIVKAPYAA